MLSSVGNAYLQLCKKAVFLVNNNKSGVDLMGCVLFQECCYCGVAQMNGTKVLFVER